MKSTQRSAYRAIRSASMVRATTSPGGVRSAGACWSGRAARWCARASSPRSTTAGSAGWRRTAAAVTPTSETTSSAVSEIGVRPSLELGDDVPPDPPGQRPEGTGEGATRNRAIPTRPHCGSMKSASGWRGPDPGSGAARAGEEEDRYRAGCRRSRRRCRAGRGRVAQRGLARPAASSRSRKAPGWWARSSRDPAGRPGRFEHRHVLGPLGRGQPVGHQQAGASREQPVGGADDPGLGQRIHPGGRLVEDDDPDVAHQQAGERHQLLLAGGQAGAARAEQRVETVGQTLDPGGEAQLGDAPLDLARGRSAKSAMFSASVPARISVRWVTTPTAARRSWRSSRRTSTPPRRSDPGGGSTARDSREARVDLPDPVRPTSAHVVPAGTVRSTPARANVPCS